MPPAPKDYTRQIESIRWKRPDADSYTNPSGALKRGTCRVTVNHPNFSSNIRKVEFRITLDKEADDLKSDLNDAITNVEHVEVLLSLRNVDSELGPLGTKIDAQSLSPSSAPFTFIVNQGKEEFASHFSYE